MVKIFFKSFSLLPLAILHGLGVLLGVLAYLLSQSYRRKNLEYFGRVYPDPTAAPRFALLSSLAHAGMAMLELPFLWGRSTKRGVATCMQLKGWEHVEAANAAGKGLIFLTPHWGSFEAAAQIFSLKAPITVLYRPNRNADVQAIIEASRGRNNIDLAPTNVTGVKKLLKALKRGEAVGMLPDQVPSNGEGVWAPTFGELAYTMTLPAKLAQMTGAPILLALGVRRPFAGFRLELYPGPSQLSANPVEAATQLNQAIERLILQSPYQYYWGYERYKLPKGMSESDRPQVSAFTHSKDSLQ